MGFGFRVAGLREYVSGLKGVPVATLEGLLGSTGLRGFELPTSAGWFPTHETLNNKP